MTTSEFEAHKHDPLSNRSIGHSVVITLYKTADNEIWVGRLTGLSYWDHGRTAATHVSPTEHFPEFATDSYVTALTTDSEENLILATLNSGLFVVSMGNRTVLPISPKVSELSDSRISSVLRFDDELWVGTLSGGVNLVSRSGIQVFNNDPLDETSLSSNVITDIFKDSKSRVWVSTYGGGLNMFKGDAEFLRIAEPRRMNHLSASKFLSVKEDHRKHLWMVEEDSGLVHLDPISGKFNRFTYESGNSKSIPEDSLYSLATTDEGVWVGSANMGAGLLNLDTEQVIRFPAMGAVYSIIEDMKGNVWFASSDGVYVRRRQSGVVEHFGKNNGFQSFSYSTGAALRLSNGLIAFGGEKGVDIFDPATLSKSSRIAPLKLVGLEINHRAVDEPPVSTIKDISLTHDHTTLQLRVAAIDFAAPHNNRYKYQLVGFDKNWIDNGTTRTITYTNLDPGSYTLKVQGTNSDGVWSSNELLIPIAISPPWWATWWAFTIYALLSLFMFYQLLIFARRRVDREADKNFSRRMLRYVESLDDTGECVINANSKGNILFANSAVKTVLGKTMDQVMGRSFFQTLFPSPAEQDRVREILESDGRFLEEIAYELPGQKKARIVEVSITKADNPGVDDIAFVSVVRDVTAHALANRELQKQHEELQRELKATVQELEDTQLESEQNQSNLEKHVELREKLLRDVHDRVNDNFHMLASLLNIQSSKRPDESSKKLLDDSQQRLSAVALVHENLLHAKDLRTVDLGNYIDSLAIMLYRKHAPKDLKIQLIKEIEPIQLDIEQAVPVGLIVNELLTNALTHAYSSRHYGSGKVSIKLYQSASDCVCEVSDDGDGLPSDFNLGASESMGLETVAILVEQLGGSFSRSGSVGTTLEFRFRMEA
ncbi:MAG: PAS domain S-box-containing protein [Candidatus Azotimanducaceae bacterium]